jgi:hypothetical protein
VIELKKRRTSPGEVELMLSFLARYALDWLAKSGAHSLFYDGVGAVAAVSIEFEEDEEAVPRPEEVLGKRVNVSPDGSIYARVRRPEDGYWICYSRTGGESPLVTVTVQRINLNRF